MLGISPQSVPGMCQYRKNGNQRIYKNEGTILKNIRLSNFKFVFSLLFLFNNVTF